MNHEETDLFTRKSIRRALKAYHNLQKLGKHPLTSLTIVDEHHQSAGRTDVPIDYGLSLQRVLRAAIEELRVDSGDPDLSSRPWRPYIILKREFVDQESPDYLAVQLHQPDGIGISPRTYQYARSRAIDRLASILREWEEDIRSIAAAGMQTIPFLAPIKPDYRLVGRSDLLCTLKRKLFADGSARLCALSGLPGVGKTALAVELVHDQEVLAHFSDGVLWAGLGREPDILAHLGEWAEALGCTPDQLSERTTVKDRQELLRAAIGQRRILLVVDDAWRSDEALAFQVGGTNCAHLATSRQPNIGLDFAGDGLIPVRELEVHEGLTLLRGLAPEAIAFEPDAAEDLVRAVDGLPLALTVMGRFLSKAVYGGQPRRLRAALARLRDITERLQLKQPQAPVGHFPALPPGMPVSVWAAIAISDETLSETTRYAFYALSVFPPKPNTFSELAAAAVAAEPVEFLDELFDSGLLENGGPGRYTLHQVIYDYAALKLEDENALERMVAYYVDFVQTHRREYDVLEVDRKNVLAALSLAHRYKMYADLNEGANAFDDFLAARGLYDRARGLLKQAEDAARQLKDSRRLASTLRNLGRAERNLGNVVAAQSIYLEAIDISENAADEDMQAIYADLNLSIGATYLDQVELDAAEQCFQRGLSVAQSIGAPELSLKLQANLGAVARRRGYLSQAEVHFRKALDQAHTFGDPEHISSLLLSLGTIAADRGDYGLASRYYRDSLTIAQEVGHRELECYLRVNLGETAHKLGDYADAEANLRQAQSVAEDIGHQFVICAISEELGVVALKRGQLGVAEEYLNDAYEMARRSGYRDYICISRLNLGLLASARGDYGLAQDHIEESLHLARAMGHRRLIGTNLCQLGELAFLHQEMNLALTHFQEALEIAQKWGMEELAADTLYGLGRVQFAQGQIAEAERLGQESLRFFVALSHSKASEIREWLTGLPSHSHD
jgi:tetratricopeptide (TPR) repeat protein